MNFVIVLECAQLDSRDYADPQSLAGFARSRNSSDSIVVSERQRPETATRRGFDYLPWWKRAVGSGRVSMKVDERRPTRRSAHFA